jgi:hypothetical protein
VIHCCFAENGYEEEFADRKIESVRLRRRKRREQVKTALKTFPLIFFNATSFRLKNGARKISVKRKMVQFCSVPRVSDNLQVAVP